MSIIEKPSPNFDERPAGVKPDMLVLHSIALECEEDNLAMLCAEDPGVSAHYMVCQDGRVLQLVSEDKKAFHAGQSFWRGRENLNDVSIGIEVSNPGFCAFTEPQMVALKDLALDIIQRHDMRPQNIVAHHEIAADRKTDPDETFDWKYLARQGVGLWPAAYDVTVKPDARVAMEVLQKLGYKMATNTDRVLAVKAFQRRYRPGLVNGKIDEITFARMKALLELFDRIA